jgi:hypothetical protein
VLGPPLQFDAAPSCEQLDVAEVRRVLAVELRPKDDTRFVTKVSADCDGPRVTLTVDDPLSRKSVTRVIDLGRTDEKARSRIVGLAAAELVTASWAELVTNPAPVVEPAMPAPPEELKDAVRSSVPKSRFFLEGTFAFAVRSPLLWGLGLRWSWERFQTFGFELEARAEHGRQTFPQGDVDVNRATLGLGAHARVELGRATYRALAVLRAGPVQLAGTAAPGSNVRASSGVGPFVGLALGGAVSARFGPVAVELGMEAGAPLAGVSALVDGVEAVRVDSLWFGAHLGVGALP